MEALTIQEAWDDQAGALIGYRLTAGNGDTLLVWLDQERMPGFRRGDAFVPDYGTTISYTQKEPA